MKKRVLALVLIVAFSVQFLVIAPSMGVYAGVNMSKMLKVDGNKLVWESDPSVVVRLTGLNVPGGEWTGTPDAERIKRGVREAMERWDSNVIRLPISVAGWYGDKSKYSYVSDGGASFRRYVNDVVTMVSDAGKYIILDLHHYKQFEDTRYKQFWKDVASLASYKNNPAVLFGILNEPHDTTWEVWRNGNGTNPGHQQIVETIRDQGAKNIIVAGGLDWAFDLRGISGTLPDDTKVYALDDQGSNDDSGKKGNGIMYDTHIYPWKGHTANWHDKVGAVRLQYPILVGENGFDPDDGTQKKYAPNAKHEIWVPELFRWMNDSTTYDNLANWTGWCFHPSSSPRILANKDNFKSDSYSYEPTSFWGVYTKAQLDKDLGNDLVAGRTATSSTSVTPAALALDSDDTTAWTTNSAGEKYLAVDLGSAKKISRWVVRHASSVSYYANEGSVTPNNTRDFKLQRSDDGITWTDVDSMSNNIIGVTDRFFSPVTTRYVRLLIIKPANTGNVSTIYQFSVYEPLMDQSVKAPKASVASGNVSYGTTVRLSCDSDYAVIRYTTDGTEPTDSSTEYTAPFVINDDITIKAKAYKLDMVSETVTFSYVVTKLTGIALKGMKTSYTFGEEFSLVRGYIQAQYTAGVNVNVQLNDPEVTITGYDMSLKYIHQKVDISYRNQQASYYITVTDQEFHGDYELHRNMNTQTPTVSSAWNGVTAAYVEGEAEDELGKALKISGGKADGGCQIALDAKDFGTGDHTFPEQYDISGFTGASYMVLRVRSTDDFSARFRIEYRNQSPISYKNSKLFGIPSTNGQWENIIIPFKNLEGSDPTWLYNMKGTEDNAPVILLRFEGMNFEKPEDYAVIGQIRMLWFSDEPNTYEVTYHEGTSVYTQEHVHPYIRLTTPVPQKDGYVFLAWYKEPEYKNLWISTLDQVSEDTTLYAKWRTAGIDYVIESIESSLSVDEVTVQGTVTAGVTNYAGVTDVSGWLAVYNSNTNMLVGISSTDISLDSGSNILEFKDCNIPSIGNGTYKAKIFIWNKADKSQPVAISDDISI